MVKSLQTVMAQRNYLRLVWKSFTWHLNLNLMFLFLYMLFYHEMIYWWEISLLRYGSNFDVSFKTESFYKLFNGNFLSWGNLIHPTKFTVQNNTCFWCRLNQQMCDFVIVQWFIVRLLSKFLQIIKSRMNTFRLSYEQFVAAHLRFLLAPRL